MPDIETRNAPENVVSAETAQWRPILHYTPEKNWINDPNGLVFFEGEYHLFYQYNPHGSTWGHMSWGHAVSPDLINWTELPVAIPEQEFMIFSGCAIVDWDNTSELGDGKKPPLLAYFTAHFDVEERQTQCLAYSHDNGRSWQMYDENPLINVDKAHHRDPNVFWHEPSQAWIMIVALPREHLIEFYRSTNLVNWSKCSVFGPTGATGGQWECPTFFQVADEAQPDVFKWILKVDVDLDLIMGGSGAQYWVGEFDGYSFTPEADEDGPICQIADHGRDFYAAICWSDLPSHHTHPVWIGWMSNHQSGKFYPTDPWRGAMTLPRELFAFNTNGIWQLGQRPIISSTPKRMLEPGKLLEQSIVQAERIVELTENQAIDLELSLSTSGASSVIVRMQDTENKRICVVWDRELHEVQLIDVDGAVHRTVRGYSYNEARQNITLRIIADRSCTEVFVDGGRVSFAECWFPQGSVSISLEAGERPVRVLDFYAALFERSVE